MALVECEECKAEVSDKAPACPRCGAPREVATDAVGDVARRLAPTISPSVFLWLGSAAVFASYLLEWGARGLLGQPASGFEFVMDSSNAIASLIFLGPALSCVVALVIASRGGPKHVLLPMLLIPLGPLVYLASFARWYRPDGIGVVVCCLGVLVAVFGALRLPIAWQTSKAASEVGSTGRVGRATGLTARAISALGLVAVVVSYFLPWGTAKAEFAEFADVTLTGIELLTMNLGLSRVEVLVCVGPLAGSLGSLLAVWRNAERWKAAWPAILVAAATWTATVLFRANDGAFDLGIGLLVCFAGLAVTAIGVSRQHQVGAATLHMAVNPPLDSAPRETTSRRGRSQPLRSAAIALILSAGVVVFWAASRIIAEITAEHAHNGADTSEVLPEGGNGAAGGAVSHPLALIDEGRGWRGKLSLCDPASAIVPAFGEPTVVDAVENVWYGNIDVYNYVDSAEAGNPLAQPFLIVQVTKAIDRVTAITYYGPWRTARGLSQGDTVLDMKRLYGEPREDWGFFGGTSYRYPDLKLAFFAETGTRRVVDEDGLPRDAKVLGGIAVALPPRDTCPAADSAGSSTVEEPTRTAGGAASAAQEPVPPDAPETQPAVAGRDVTAEVVASATASSSKFERYSAAKAFDGRPDTAWNEGAPGPGVGEWIEVQFVRPTQVAYVMITPGWDHATERGDLFTANRHMTSFNLDYGNSRRRAYRVPAGVRVFRADLEGEVTNRLRITATSVSTDEARWDDLCISEVRIFEVADAAQGVEPDDDDPNAGTDGEDCPTPEELGVRPEAEPAAPATRQVRLERTEVTVDSYAACVRADSCAPALVGAGCNTGQPGRGSHPINCVDSDQAAAYCRWAGERLPTSGEWEQAARGPGRLYPWGNELPDCSRADFAFTGDASQSCGGQGTSPVGSHAAGATPEGIEDLAGNVWEWTSTPGDSDGSYIVRGGTWGSPARELLATSTRSVDGASRRAGIGFRCAR